MIQGLKGIKYGLTVPASKKKKPALAAQPGSKLAVFGDDSDEEHEAVPQQLARQAASKKQNNKVAEMHAAALAEDASVFDYDGVYDDIQQQREAPLKAERAHRSSKYIEGLLDKAEERKREQDIIFERRQVKEREAEDHLFGDKEKFVTAAYKKKLQEQQLWEARQKIKDERDEAAAAEKIGDMSGFYGSLLTKNVAFGAKSGKQEAKTSDSGLDAALPRSAGGTGTAAPASDRVRSSSEMAKPSGQQVQPSRTEDGDLPAASEERAGGSAAEREPGNQPESGGQAEDRGAKENGPDASSEARPSAVRHTDDAAREAARERYLARKKRKIAVETDV